MLTFQGISLSDVAPINLLNVKIEPPKIKVYSQDRPVSTGEYFIRSKYAPRLISISYNFSRGTQDMIAEWTQNIYKWAHGAAPGELTIPNRPGQYAMAKCTALPSEALMGNRHDVRTIEFTLYDAMFITQQQIAVPCGMAFEIDGVDNASGYILQTNAASVIDPEWMLDGDQYIALDGTIAAGTIKVDLDRKTVTLDDVSQMANVTLQSRFFELTPGLHTITGDGTLLYRQRWL